MKPILEEGDQKKEVHDKIIKNLSKSRDHKKAAKTSSRFRHYLKQKESMGLTTLLIQRIGGKKGQQSQLNES